MSTIPKVLKLKDYITLTGTALGVTALICACIGTRSFISLGFFLISITLGTDLLDGYIARKTGTVNKIGIELDSLSDSLTFGIAPAVLIYQAFKTGGIYDIVIIIGCICFTFGAILRLARFNTTTEDEIGYTGVPTPLSCLLIILFFYTNYFYAFALGGGGEDGLNEPFPALSYYIAPLIMILISWFNITTHISFGEKSKFEFTLFLCISPLCPIFALIGIMNPDFMVSMILSIIFLVSFIILFVYLILGFFFNWKNTTENRDP